MTDISATATATATAIEPEKVGLNLMDDSIASTKQSLSSSTTSSSTTTNPTVTNTSVTTLNQNNSNNHNDHSNNNFVVVRNNETILLHFVDGRQLFAYCSYSDRRKSVVRIQKRTYTTQHLIGLPYGTILNVVQQQQNGRHQLIPHQEEEQQDPHQQQPEETAPTVLLREEEDDDSVINNTNPTETTAAATTTTTTTAVVVTTKDNRHLVDTNTAQTMPAQEVTRMKVLGYNSNEIITSLVQHSTTFATKTQYAQEKYILRKQQKHSIQCRIVPCHANTICEALYRKDSKKYRNVRCDTLGQILSYSNICAGCHCLVYDDNYGIVLSSVCERMNGYGILYAIYESQQPSFTEMFTKFNLSFVQMNCIQYVHCGDLFTTTATATTTIGTKRTRTATDVDATRTTNDAVDDDMDITTDNDGPQQTDTVDSTTTLVPTQYNDATMMSTDDDYERIEREKLIWPCSLQDHTRTYLQTNVPNGTDRNTFLQKRASRFARKLCRSTNLESKHSLLYGTSAASSSGAADCANNTTTNAQAPKRLCDSLILMTKYDPTQTLLQLFPYLAPSSPYVIYCEYIEPLTECFKQIQTNPALLSINLRLSDTWMREYQILHNRTHPAMSMSQSGGFILTGIKLHPLLGQNEFNDVQLKEIRTAIGSRRTRNNRKKVKPVVTTTTIPSSNKNDNDNISIDRATTANKNQGRKRKDPPTATGAERDDTNK
jgi:tRNA (adenine58-N1)-methyltransferase non-catalytic subunit